MHTFVPQGGAALPWKLEKITDGPTTTAPLELELELELDELVSVDELPIVLEDAVELLDDTPLELDSSDDELLVMLELLVLELWPAPELEARLELAALEELSCAELAWLLEPELELELLALVLWL